MSDDYTFQGWMGLDASSVDGNLKFQTFEPKTFQETDVDIKVTHCGICGSDIHTLRSGWGKTNYPCCVGHEILGTAVKVGSKAENGIKYVFLNVFSMLYNNTNYSLELGTASALGPRVILALSRTAGNALLAWRITALPWWVRTVPNIKPVRNLMVATPTTGVDLHISFSR